MADSNESSFLGGGGEMGERMRAFDWSRHPLGPVESWPQSLKTAVRIMLTSRYAMFVWWGKDRINFYNDAYRSVLGPRHPAALGRPAREVWAEIWDMVGPRSDAVLQRGEATYDERLLLMMERHGYREETYFTFSYSPVPGDSGQTEGMFCACTEDTQAVIGERRLRTLRDVATAAAGSKSRDDLLAAASQALAAADRDLPFACLYTLDRNSDRAVLTSRSPEAAHAAFPMTIDLGDAGADWPVAEALRTKAAVELVLDGPLASLPPGAWDRSPTKAILLPFGPSGAAEPDTVLVAGLNPYLRPDDSYRSFLDLLVGQIAAGLASAEAYEQERRRAEALAELDRAKTAFFSNISHEFRTPLTLMLGPLEDALADASGRPPAEFERLELAHRNSLRLLKLVNSLLDFSRIEAGRIDASYEPLDLASLTRDLAGVFRAGIERAGLKLIVDCPPLPEPVYVDREMWEKVVFNLLSNAFKFTFEGEIEVSLRPDGAAVELTVRDTGTGIPQHDIPHLFERFYRVKEARGRSHEGSGIGLALVQELVRLHGGSVRAESEIERGSRFIVSLPLGKMHLPAERIRAARTLVSTAVGGDAYVQEALRWLPDSSPAGAPAENPPSGKRILLADDNADMRDYVRRLLAQRGHTVEAVPDGAAALRAARQHRPDLILADVMMPVMDGIGLLQALRADRSLAALPVILLSARAGEDARIEGMKAGADDYLTKPFAARELLIRVESRLSMAVSRNEVTEVQQRLASIVESSDDAIISKDLNGTLVSWNQGAERLFGYTAGEAIGKPVLMLIPEDRQNEEPGILERIRRGERIDHYETIRRRKDGSLVDISLTVSPIRDARGKIVGASKIARDISQRRQAEKTRQLLLNELNHRVKNTLATVQAIVQQTLRSTRDPADFAARFSGRIQSLARVHALLTDSTWQGADLRELIRDQLLQGPVDDTRLTAWGPAIRLGPETTLHTALMLHELGTNSAKYGALSVSTGWVAVNWSVKGGRLHLQWVERGGPPVRLPVSRGFGTTLIEQSAKSEGGSARMLCEAEGITWQIELALSESAGAHAPASELVSQAPPPEAVLSAKPRPILAGLRFLVVEDEPLIALSLVDTLENAGAQVSEPVGTEKEALQAIEQGELDGALLDANLHGRPVQEIAAALTRRGVPFVFVTGYGREGAPGGFRHVPVVTKPFTDRQLLDAVTGLVIKSGSVVKLKP